MRPEKTMSPWTMPLVAAAILLWTGTVLVALWLWVDGQAWKDQEKRTLAQLDVVKVASGIALGGGGLFTLYLAARRQRTQEEAQVATNADAEARRITELYSKAVQQLGDDKAAVRLGGLYALERLGQREKDTRRTIVNVLCAYLRMRYTPPSDRTASSAGVHRPLLHGSRRRTGIQAPRGQGTSLADVRLELDVRLTAQRILTEHLKPGDHNWGTHDINLNGAVLVDFSVAGCELASATFDHASFHGKTWFSADFTGHVSFDGASFADTASFHEARFESTAVFADATFGGRAQFDNARFADPVSFSGCTFRAVTFQDTLFASYVKFGGTTFDGRPVTHSAELDKAWVKAGLPDEYSEWPAGWKRGPRRAAHPTQPGRWDGLVQDV